MTFDDDVVRLVFDGGTKTYTCKELGLSWPPPEKFTFQNFEMRLLRASPITDAQRARMKNIARGAEYLPVEVPIAN